MRIWPWSLRAPHPHSDVFYAVPATVPAERVEIGRELSRLEEGARWSSQGQFEQSKFWRGWNLLLGIPSFAFGVASGATVLGDYAPDLVVGSLALAGATLAGLMTILAAERKSDRAATDANAFHDIQGHARRLLLIDLATLDTTEAQKSLDELCERYAEIRRGTDPIMKRAYTRAGNNLHKGGQTFGIDNAPPPHQSTTTP